MRLDGDDAREVLADAWDRWARRCATLSPEEWSTPTRCSGWDVAALLAHVCPDSTMFVRLSGAIVDGPAAVTDAAEMLRRLNKPDGIAHTTADTLAEQAVADAAALTPDAAAARCGGCQVQRMCPDSALDTDVRPHRHRVSDCGKHHTGQSSPRPR